MNALRHRGPDGEGMFEAAGLALGHHRLSIIDLAGGAQPMTLADAELVIIFNGEIVNYKALRDELSARGQKFRTTSDTEVILAAYLAFGARCVERLRGFFAFAIYDGRNGEIFIARDHSGIKPLFFHSERGAFVFSSEMRALYATGLPRFGAAKQHFNEFLVFGSVAGSETLHTEIGELPAGHTLTVRAGIANTPQRYWWPSGDPRAEKWSEDEALTELEHKLQQAVRLWAHADVPVGAFLSGGIDSTLVTTFASQSLDHLLVLTAWFPDSKAVDERTLARAGSARIGATQIEVALRSDYLMRNLGRLISHTVLPVHDSNSITFMGLCESLRQHSDLKVVLVGDYADELFAGYERHITISEELARKDTIDTIVYGLNRVALPRLELFASDVTIKNSTRWDIAGALTAREPLGRVLEMDQLLFIPPYLLRQDQIGMMYGLEARPPFLDHELVALVNGLHADFKVREMNGVRIHKYLLRQLAESYLPAAITENQTKYRFTLPTAESLAPSGVLNALFREMIGRSCELSKYYEPAGMIELLNRHDPQCQETDHSNTLWRLLTLEMWLRAAPQEIDNLQLDRSPAQ
jgi:asparagine synthase (glutamine-hydrolysing)